MLHSLLPCLTGRFAAVRDLGSGGESDVLLVTDGSGAVWVVKQYRRPGWAPDSEVLGVLADRRVGQDHSSWTSDPRMRHVLWLQEWGTDPSTDLFFEIQEFIEEGALAGADAKRGSWSRFQDWPAEVLADAVVDAVASFQTTLGGAHRDVTPANLLVRSADPLVLVLADVGLSRNLGEASHRYSKRDGTAAYQAPEAAAQGKVTRGGDWWAAGMIIAEVALGRHPLALPDGSLPDNAVLQVEIVERPVPLEGIADARLRLLCQGLLSRDSERRWGLPQIAEWRKGGSPATGYGSGGSESASPKLPTQRLRKVLFAGRDYDSPSELARAFMQSPDRAGQMLFLNRDDNLVEDLRLMLAGYGLPEAYGYVASYRSGAWQPAFLRLVVEMDPDLDPVLAGQSMTPQSVAEVARQVIETGRATDQQRQTLTWVLDHHLWRLWRDLQGMADALQASEVLASQNVGSGLSKAGPANPELVELLGRDAVAAFWGAAEPRIDALRVMSAVSPRNASVAVQRVLERAEPGLHDQQWWMQLAHSSEAADRVVAAVGLGLAQEASRTAEERRRIQKEKAREARQQDERQRLLDDPERLRLRSELSSLRGSEFLQRYLGMFGMGAFMLMLSVMSYSIVRPMLSGDMSWDDFGGTLGIFGVLFAIAGVFLVLNPPLTFLTRRSRRRELEAELARPLPFDDPAYKWSDTAGTWVRSTSRRSNP